LTLCNSGKDTQVATFESLEKSGINQWTKRYATEKYDKSTTNQKYFTTGRQCSLRLLAITVLGTDWGQTDSENEMQTHTDTL